MQYTPIWSNSENKISLYDETFSDLNGLFCISFHNVNTCEETKVDITEIKRCKDEISFYFSIECDPKPGTYTADLIRKSDGETICEKINIRIYDNG